MKLFFLIAALLASTQSWAEVTCDKEAIESSINHLLAVTNLGLDQIKSCSIGNSGRTDEYYITYRVDFESKAARRLQVISMFNIFCELEEIACFENTDFCKP